MSIATTRTISVQLALNARYGKNTIRPTRAGVYDLFRKQMRDGTSFLDPAVKSELDRSMGHDVVIPMWDSEEVTLGNVRSCPH